MMARYTHEGDTAKARQLLEESGWDFDREITEKAPGYAGPILVQFAAEQQMLADAGLKVKYETMETQAWAAVYYENYNYDSVRVGGWGGTVDAMDYYFHSTLSNPMGYANPELDALLDKVPRALTNQELVDIGIKMNEMFIEDLPIVVILLAIAPVHLRRPCLGSRVRQAPAAQPAQGHSVHPRVPRPRRLLELPDSRDRHRLVWQRPPPQRDRTHRQADRNSRPMRHGSPRPIFRLQPSPNRVHPPRLQTPHNNIASIGE